ncbi:MAG: DNA helicase [Bacteroidetes bacterium 4484_249]|nr:MAG: DNA helicase [Bacteroidetes bacterium 4484_249]
MQLTNEQKAIINSKGNIKINAVAGSGKTTTIIEYAKSRPSNKKILYLAFNKSVKNEAVRKFTDFGLANVKVETAHSLAYKNIVFNNNYTVKHAGYKNFEIVEILEIKGTGEKLTEFITANHINKFISYFCNSNKKKVSDLNYLEVVSDQKARTFVKNYYKYIEKNVRLFLAKMDRGEIDVTHDFYLKKFQLSNPKLHYDYILFDEGQDASPAMLDIFLKQKSTKVIVGDVHQQIYAWRYAINSLEKVDFKDYYLTTSFRFNQEIGNLATRIIERKNIFNDYTEIKIAGAGNCKSYKSKAVLARTNLGLLMKAIEYVTEKKKIENIYFEGNINSYTYADDGASLYDVLNLYNGKRRYIKDKLIRSMRSMNDLNDYIEKTEDVQLAMMVEIVIEYGNDIPDIIKKIKEKHIDGDMKENAQMIFSTVHRSKGMEYEAVQLVNDFMTKEKLKKLYDSNKESDLLITKLNEEVNLLYVALTRTKNSIHIPGPLMPDEFPKSSHIHIMNVEEPDSIAQVETGSDNKQTISSYKAYSYEDVRKKHKKAYEPWTNELDDELTIMYCEGIHVKDMAKHFGRTRGAIKLRIKKLELEEKYS